MHAVLKPALNRTSWWLVPSELLKLESNLAAERKMNAKKKKCWHNLQLNCIRFGLILNGLFRQYFHLFHSLRMSVCEMCLVHPVMVNNYVRLLSIIIEYSWSLWWIININLPTAKHQYLSVVCAHVVDFLSCKLCVGSSPNRQLTHRFGYKGVCMIWEWMANGIELLVCHWKWVLWCIWHFLCRCYNCCRCCCSVFFFFFF